MALAAGERRAVAEAPAMPRPRRGWLDLQRGLAVVFMVEVHALDAWLAPGARAGVAHDVLLMVGGFAAPSFLFMAGLSQALGEASLRRRSVPALARLATHLRRAGWLLAVAYGFRIAEWLLGGQWRAPGGWSDVLRVDVLNVIALGLALAAPLALVPRRSAVAVAAAAAAAIALATPPIADWAHEPSRVLDYLWATWPRGHFSLFNWAAFLLAGSAAGALLAERDGPALLLAIGAALLAAGWAADRLPPFYARQDFWRASPSWLAMRLGGVCILAGALQLLPARGAAALPALTTLGRHSLLGYVASVELTYGALAAPLRRALSLPAVLAGVVVLLAVTWTLARAAEAWPTWQAAKACAQPRAKASGAHHAS